MKPTNPGRGFLVQLNMGGLSCVTVGGEPICGEIYDKSGNISVNPKRPRWEPGQICQLYFESQQEFEAAKKGARMVLEFYCAMMTEKIRG